jgi:hypothetical protein
MTVLESPGEQYKSLNGFMPVVPVVCRLRNRDKRHAVSGFVFIIHGRGRG